MTDVSAFQHVPPRGKPIRNLVEGLWIEGCNGAVPRVVLVPELGARTDMRRYPQRIPRLPETPLVIRRF